MFNKVLTAMFRSWVNASITLFIYWCLLLCPPPSRVHLTSADVRSTKSTKQVSVSITLYSFYKSLIKKKKRKWKKERDRSGRYRSNLPRSLEKVATHSSNLAWRIPWTEEPGELQSMGLQRVRHDLASKQQTGKNKHPSKKFLENNYFLLSHHIFI